MSKIYLIYMRVVSFNLPKLALAVSLTATTLLTALGAEANGPIRTWRNGRLAEIDRLLSPEPQSLIEMSGAQIDALREERGFLHVALNDDVAYELYQIIRRLQTAEIDLIQRMIPLFTSWSQSELNLIENYAFQDKTFETLIRFMIENRVDITTWSEDQTWQFANRLDLGQIESGELLTRLHTLIRENPPSDTSEFFDRVLAEQRPGSTFHILADVRTRLRDIRAHQESFMRRFVEIVEKYFEISNGSSNSSDTDFAISTVMLTGADILEMAREERTGRLQSLDEKVQTILRQRLQEIYTSVYSFSGVQGSVIRAYQRGRNASDAFCEQLLKGSTTTAAVASGT